jgi:hypothetical protein
MQEARRDFNPQISTSNLKLKSEIDPLVEILWRWDVFGPTLVAGPSTGAFAVRASNRLTTANNPPTTESSKPHISPVRLILPSLRRQVAA